MIPDEDSDVREERNRVNSYMNHPSKPGDSEHRVVAVQGLRKEFKTNEGKQEKTKPQWCGKKKDSLDDREESKSHFHMGFSDQDRIQVLFI